MPLKTLIVDDEPLARTGLRMLLVADPAFTAIDEAANGFEAIRAIRDRRPDLVFLDVQMPEMDGFSVVQSIGPDRMPAVVFVTAHDQYAIRAFDVNAIDYLLKPVTRERFAEALKRVRSRLPSAQEYSQQIAALLETIASRSRYVSRLAVRSASKTSFVEVASVDWMQAAENYVQLHVGRANHLLHVTMNRLESSLDPELFVRVHRSIIVNIRQIKEIQAAQHGEYVILLHSGVRIQSSRSYHTRVKALTANRF
jgi:two-component system, LytTR family, response regulator